MTSEFAPRWTHRCTAADLSRIPRDEPYLLRVSGDDPSGPWRYVKTRTRGMFIDPETGVKFYYLTLTFHDDDRERMLNDDDLIVAGFDRQPSWFSDA